MSHLSQCIINLLFEALNIFLEIHFCLLLILQKLPAAKQKCSPRDIYHLALSYRHFARGNAIKSNYYTITKLITLSVHDNQ